MHHRSSPLMNGPTSKTYLSGYNPRKQEKRIEYESYDDTTPLSLTESEWLSRVPSFAGDHANNGHMGQTRSFGGDKYGCDAEESALLRQQALDWYETAAGNAAEHADTDNLRDYNEQKIPGSWV
jgi:hypothetical protein